MLIYEAVLAYCLAKPECQETYSFDADTRVFKVRGKMFALMPASNESISLKCDPAMAIVLRDNYSSIVPGYHMNKEHWNTVYLNDELAEALVMDMIDDSYRLVVKGLRRADREAIMRIL